MMIRHEIKVVGRGINRETFLDVLFAMLSVGNAEKSY